MCTVSFIPSGDRYFLCSNRDERYARARAQLPAHYHCPDGMELLYPKDPEAGGTWIAVRSNGVTGVLLNGAFENHVRRLPYRKSRGLVFLDILSSSWPVREFQLLNLQSIEPFTLVIYDGEVLHELKWDGQQKHQAEFDKQKPHLWSSATLYDRPIREARENWFSEWLSTHPVPEKEDILKFHSTAGNHDPQNGLLMRRGNDMGTLSITIVSLLDDHCSLYYQDQVSGDFFETRVESQSKQKVSC
jgi:hypothetical protein